MQGRLFARLQARQPIRGRRARTGESARVKARAPKGEGGLGATPAARTRTRTRTPKTKTKTKPVRCECDAARSGNLSDARWQADRRRAVGGARAARRCERVGRRGLSSAAQRSAVQCK